MPIYDYLCSKCNKTVELFRRMGDHPTRCPNCGETGGMTNQISTSNFHLKGSGWYKTDYGKNQ